MELVQWPAGTGVAVVLAARSVAVIGTLSCLASGSIPVPLLSKSTWQLVVMVLLLLLL